MLFRSVHPTESGSTYPKENKAVDRMSGTTGQAFTKSVDTVSIWLKSGGLLPFGPSSCTKSEEEPIKWELTLLGSDIGRFLSAAAFAADREIKIDDRLDASADTLTDMMRASDQGIPRDLLDKARCVVVGARQTGHIAKH